MDSVALGGWGLLWFMASRVKLSPALGALRASWPLEQVSLAGSDQGDALEGSVSLSSGVTWPLLLLPDLPTGRAVGTGFLHLSSTSWQWARICGLLDLRWNQTG